MPGAQPRPQARHRSRQRRADPVRKLAYEVIRQVNGDGAYAHLALGQALHASGISGRDAAFCTELVHGTLRWQGTYDVVLALCVSRPLDRLDPELLDLLRLGCHQLLRMRVGSYAAVDETVTLARMVLGPARSGLVNAVLRAVGRRTFDDWVETVAPAGDPIGRLVIAYAHPRWIIQVYADALSGERGRGLRAGAAPGAGEALPAGQGGEVLAEVEQVLAHNAPPRVDLVARPGLATVAELVTAGAARCRWSPHGAVLSGGDPADIPAVSEGRAGVQDEGSQLVAVALATAPLDGRDERWLDLCAGPGGKTALLAAIGAERGAVVTAVEPYLHRAKLVRRNLRAVPGGHQALVADGTVPAWRPGQFDRVLADVPCTGLGALRRRPDARWRHTPDDVTALRPLQEGLLDSALTSVRPGGLVAYVTCSPHVGETRAVVDAVLGSRGELVDARGLLGELPKLGDGPDVQLWPHRHGTDGMYLALIRRTLR